MVSIYLQKLQATETTLGRRNAIGSIVIDVIAVHVGVSSIRWPPPALFGLDFDGICVRVVIIVVVAYLLLLVK